MSEKREEPVPVKRCFTITPIGAEGSPERRHADWVLFGAIKPVFEAAGYEVFRADTIADPGMINDAIFEHVIDDTVCIADLTFLNANVLYELGVRHALSKPVIHIAAAGTVLPFDNAQHRAIFFDRDDYRSFEALKEHLAAQLATIEAPGFVVSNPLTHAKGRQKLRTGADPKDKILEELISNVLLLSKRIDNITLNNNSINPNSLLGYKLDTDSFKISRQKTLENMAGLIRDYATVSALGDRVSMIGLDTTIQALLKDIEDRDRIALARIAHAAGVPDAQLKSWQLLHYLS